MFAHNIENKKAFLTKFWWGFEKIDGIRIVTVASNNLMMKDILL